MPKFTYVHGNTFRDDKGKFRSSRYVAEHSIPVHGPSGIEDIDYRKKLYEQRTNDAQQLAFARGHYNHRIPAFNANDDAFLSIFSSTPYDQRTSAEWKHFREVMTHTYGEIREDWGPYY